MNTLLHPDYFDGIPVFGNEIKKRFEDIEADTQPSNREKEGITVAIRTLNEAGKLEDLLQDIERQELNGEVEVVVIDNESSILKQKYLLRREARKYLLSLIM